jgi:hypothetical protein
MSDHLGFQRYNLVIFLTISSTSILRFSHGVLDAHERVRLSPEPASGTDIDYSSLAWTLNLLL